MSKAVWSVKLSRKTGKDFRLLPERVRLELVSLIQDLERKGPMQPNWPNFSKLETDLYHCHLKKGKPTYVACWQVLNKHEKIIEVYYAGTHEKAPY